MIGKPVRCQGSVACKSVSQVAEHDPSKVGCLEVNGYSAESRAVTEEGYVMLFDQVSAYNSYFVGGICSINTIKSISMQARLQKLKESPVFQPGIGEVVGHEATLQLKEDHSPVFRKARSVPFAIKERIEVTLQKMTEDKILKPVDNSEYASPIVPVEKEDGSIRICGDYKATLNPNLLTKQYPLPTVEECFQPMNGGQLFSKLDIRQAYNNLKLRESDQKLTTINTSKGLFVWTRLPYGISSSTAIFQQSMDRVLQGLNSVVCRVDDILVTGRDDEEHLSNLEEVIRRLETAGFRCNLKKTQFMKDEVVYLGYRINRKGVRPCEGKVETLLKAAYPSDVSSLVSFLGAVNYYARFIKNLSTVVEPLNRLRRADVPWEFGDKEKQAFDELKNILASSSVIVPYDPSLPVKMDTDASSVGIGAVLSHIMPDGTERPIEMASRTLTAAERNYSQIEKEALSIIWGLKKYHKYLYARRFTLVTDHKPLIFILKENKGIPEMGASRILRWAITLSSYQYHIEYRPTGEHANADVCSRYPLERKEQDCEVERDGKEVSDVFFNSFIDKPLINHVTISKFTRTDPVLSKVKSFIRSGWNPKVCKAQADIKPYFERKDELSVEYECVLWGTRVVIPKKLRGDVLNLLHVSHSGIVTTKAIARSYVWWPGINEDIEQVTTECQACQLSQKNPPKAKPHPWTPSTTPWERIHVDFCGPVDKRMWLVVVDSYSKWNEVIDMRTCTTTESTIKELRKLFARFGLPVTVVSDNGPQLVSEEMKTFFENNGIQHIPVPKYSPQCNGLAERGVKSFKEAMERARRTSSDFDLNLQRWLLHYRNTPHCTTKESPANKMFSRPTRNLLSLLDPLTNVERKQRNDGTGPDKTRKFEKGEKVRVLDVRSKEWFTGIVTGSEGCKVFLVQSRGSIERRHVDHLRKYTEQVDVPSKTEETEKLVHKPVSKPTEHLTDKLKPILSHEIPLDTSSTHDSTPQVSVELPSTTALPRRSSRVKSSVDRLGYKKLGGENAS